MPPARTRRHGLARRVRPGASAVSPLFCAALAFLAPLAADEWQPAKGPLLTRWAKDVKPDKVHPEYPRPQMVRERWQNLNGLWQYAEAKEGDKPPVGKD